MISEVNSGNGNPKLMLHALLCQVYSSPLLIDLGRAHVWQLGASKRLRASHVQTTGFMVLARKYMYTIHTYTYICL